MLAYLDHAAGGPLRPEAAAAMAPWWAGRYGNPSGAHQVSRSARSAIDDARDVIAGALGVAPGEVIFTSGGTEADNLAVTGVLAGRPGPVVVSAIEHPAVLEAAWASGHEVRLAPVTTGGALDLDGLGPLLDRSVALVSVQLVNHEVGTVQPFEEVVRLVRRRAPGALVHTDAVQAFPWVDVAEAARSADLVSISGHKFGGPQGSGALATRGAPRLVPLLRGGGQEREQRSGTPNVAGIAGLAAAAGATVVSRASDAARVAAARDALAATLLGAVAGCVQTAAGAPRVPGHLHLRFAEVESEALLVLLDQAGVCASAGSACASGAMDPSPVLLAMGVAKKDALSSLRLTLGPATTAAEVDLAARVIPASVASLRGG